MKRVLSSVIVALLFLWCASCATPGSIIRSADVMKLHPGMIEEEVIAILQASPKSRSYYLADGTYLLCWGNPREMEGRGDIRYLVILFTQDRRMVAIVDQETFITEDHY